MKGRSYTKSRLGRLITALLLSVMMTVTFVPTAGFAGTADQADDGTQAEQNVNPQSGDNQGEVVEESAEAGKDAGEKDASEEDVNAKGIENAPDNLRSAKNGEVTVTLTVPTEALIHEDVEFRAEASEKVDQLAIYFDLDNNANYYSYDIEVSEYNTTYDYYAAGIYRAKAVAYGYNEEEGEYSVLGESQEVEVTVTSNGKIGDFSIISVNGNEDLNPTITRGDTVTIKYKEAEGAEEYWTSVEKWDEEANDWQGYDHGVSFSEGDSINLNTIQFEPGQYRIQVNAQGVGYEQNSSSNTIVLTMNEREVVEGEVYFSVPKSELFVNEEFECTAYYPGADEIRVFVGEEDVYRGEEGSSITTIWSYGKTGEYTLYAAAYEYDEDTEEYSEIARSSEITVQVSSKGVIETVMPELPEYIVAGTEEPLSFTVTKPSNAETVSVNVSCGKGEGDDEWKELFDKDTSEDELNVKIDVSELDEGDLVFISIVPHAFGYEIKDVEATIPVVGAVSDDVTINAEDDEVLIYEKVRVNVEAVNGKKIESVRLFDGYRLWDAEEPDDDGTYSTELSFWNAEKYSIYAEVLLEGSEGEWVFCKPITITASSLGHVGHFSITEVNGKSIGEGTEVKVTRGDVAEIVCDQAANADHYWTDLNIWSEADDDWTDCDVSSDSNNNIIELDTAELAPGSYEICVGATGVGYYEEWSTNEFTLVVEDEGLPEGEMLLKVDKQELLTGEGVEFTAACTGADSIIVYPDYDNDKDWTCSGEGDYLRDEISYDEGGTYNLHAEAYKEGESEPIAQASLTMTVTSNGPLQIVMPQLPEFVAAGKDDTLSFTAVKPENAEGFSVDIWAESDKYDEGFADLYRNETSNNSMVVEVDISDVPENAVIVVEIGAWGTGYDYTHQEARISVIGETSNDVTITASKTDVLINEDVEVTVKANDAKIEEVELYGDGDLWESETLDDDADGIYKGSVSFDEVGSHSLYAKVTLEGGNGEWITCAPITFNVTANGEVGNFKILSVNGDEEVPDITVTQGGLVSIACSTSENADHYWAEIEKYDEDSDDYWPYDRLGDAEEPNISLATAELDPGKYLISIGANALGCESKLSTNSFELTVEELQEGEMSLVVSKDKLLTCEEFTFSVVCPGADRIVLYLDYDGDDSDSNWEMEDNRLSDTATYNYAGTYTLRAEAYEEGSEEPIASAEKTIEVTAPNGELDITMPEMPETVCAGGRDFSFTLTKPEHAEEINVWVYDNDDDEAVTLFEGGTTDDALSVNVPASKFVSGQKLCIEAEAIGVGYELTTANKTIQVVSHNIVPVEAKEATCEEDGNIEHWECTHCGMKFKDEDGTEAFEDDSWLRPGGHEWTHVVNPAGYMTYGADYWVCPVCHKTKDYIELPGIATSFVKKLKVSKGKGKMTIKWKKQSKKNRKKFNGYQIRYSTNPNMSGAVYLNAGTKAKSKKVKRLLRKTVYYVQVRSYTIVNGKPCYSAWSTKSVKTK